MPDPVTPPATTNEPAIPAKFVKEGKPDYAALASAYTELEKKLGSSGNPPATQTDQGAASAAPAPAANPGQQAASQTTPDAFSAFEQEFVKEGKLSDKSYTELQTKFNLSKEVVNDFISFRQGRAENFAKQVTDSVGGIEQYQQLIEWADKNLSKDEQAAFNKSVLSGDVNVANMAVGGLKTRFEKANGKEPSLVQGSTSSGGIMPFASASEAAAFKGKRGFETDSNLQREYYQRLSVSNW